MVAQLEFVFGLKYVFEEYKSTATCLNVLLSVTLDNPQTSLWGVFVGTLFYQRNSPNENC